MCRAMTMSAPVLVCAIVSQALVMEVRRMVLVCGVLLMYLSIPNRLKMVCFVDRRIRKERISCWNMTMSASSPMLTKLPMTAESMLMPSARTMTNMTRKAMTLRTMCAAMVPLMRR